MNIKYTNIARIPVAGAIVVVKSDVAFKGVVVVSGRALVVVTAIGDVLGLVTIVVMIIVGT